jgi:hypothetical protein
LHELVAIAFVIEPWQPAAAMQDVRIVLQITEVRCLARPVAATQHEPRRVVELQVVDE